VSQYDNQLLIRIPDTNEIKDALFSIDANKTPGPDGFGAGFFQFYSDRVKIDLRWCVIEFFINGKMLKQMNRTFITLIPKRSNPSETSHYRPISLCNTVYMTISKIMVNWLRPLLNNLVSPLQSAFISGRSIHENILLKHEIMHKYRKFTGKTAWVALKPDMEKAYDTID